MSDCTCPCELRDLDVCDKAAVNRIIPVNTLTHCEDITGERGKHIWSPSMSDAIQYLFTSEVLYMMCFPYNAYADEHSNPSESLDTSICANKYSSSAGVIMRFPGIRRRALMWLHARTHTHMIVCPCAHGCISVCMLCVCILILTWKGTSTPIYYLLKIKSWRQTTVISVGQIAFPPPTSKRTQ